MAEQQIAQARASRARARIHADPARPARGRRAAGAGRARRHAAGDGRGARARSAERATIEALVDGASPETRSADRRRGRPRRCAMLARDRRGCSRRITKSPALLHALDGRFVRPAPGGDLLRTPAVLPTGRNLHGFDPFRIPSAFAVRGRRAAGGSGCSSATCATATPCRKRSRWCCGAPTTSRPKAGRSRRRWR